MTTITRKAWLAAVAVTLASASMARPAAACKDSPSESTPTVVASNHDHAPHAGPDRWAVGGWIAGAVGVACVGWTVISRRGGGGRP